MQYEMIEKLQNPSYLSELDMDGLNLLCSQIREFLIEKVCENGGHLASNLGVVELSVALHRVYKTPHDKIVWDVGHQAYVHKILTGRYKGFDTLRKFGGMSGFPKTNESEHDSFNTGHSSTSVSAALGIARARDLKEESFDIAAVFGDGALTGGMMYEAMSDLGHRKTPMVLILNDNEMSISKNVGGVSKYLRHLRQTNRYHNSKKRVERVLDRMPHFGAEAKRLILRIKDAVRLSVLPATLFDDLGIEYLGPVDGHNISELISVLNLAKEMKTPVIVHVITKKGKGYILAEENPQDFHGISPKANKVSHSEKYKDYSECMGKSLLAEAEKNRNIAAITAAMPDGVGFSEIAKKYPERFFDVGICEQHAVTLAAGLAISGITPVFGVYSSFLQRSYDQLLHDVCLQRLHCVFLVDRAGIVGADGETHHGVYDIAYLSAMPYMKILSPSSFSQAEQMLNYAINECDSPVAIRYPRGNSNTGEASDFVYGRVNSYGTGEDCALITSGRMLKTALSVMNGLLKENISITVLEMTVISPIPADLKEKLSPFKRAVTLEDHTVSGGMGEKISAFIHEENLDICKKTIAFPNEPIVQGEISQLEALYGLDEKSVYEKIKSFVLTEDENG